MFLSIARKEHKSPSEIENWSLPDVTLVFSSIYDEGKELEKLEKDIPQG